MKILFTWHSLVEPQYQIILNYLSRNNCEVTAICPTKWTEGGERLKLINPLEANHLKIEPLRIIFHDRIKVFFYPEFFKLAKLIKNFKPEVIHIFEEPYSLVVFQFILLTKILRLRPKILIQSFENIFFVQPFPFSLLEKFNLSMTTALITVPGEGKKIWRDKGFDKEIFRLAVGVDHTLFRKTNGKRTNEVTIGFIGRLIKEKGVYLLLNVFIELVKRGLFVQLIFVGEGREKKELKEIVKSNRLSNQVNFINRIENKKLPEFLSQEVDILVLPSLTTEKWKEQFGRVLIEAMACEVAVVGSSSGEIPEVIGGGGIIFPENNADSLLSALKLLVLNKNLREELGKKGRKRVLENYTWEGTTEQLLKVYKDVSI